MILKNSSLYVGFFLAIREIKRSNFWTTFLIIFIMTLTFINMNLVGGILIGIAKGVISGYRQYYSSNIIITPSTNKNTIEQTSNVTNIIESLPTKISYSPRITSPAILEYGYKSKVRSTDLSESVAGELTGIDPEKENTTTRLSKTIIAGEYLLPSDVDQILVGSSLIKKYSSLRGSSVNVGARILKNADIGSRIRMTVNGIQKEVFIKGVVSTDVTNMDNRIYMVDTAVNELLGNTSLAASEIPIHIMPNASEDKSKDYLERNINNENILIKTSIDALPGGITDVFSTFGILGNVIGSIALVVGAITIFIVIFVNAVTRRKYIGILKGIGITQRAIEISYVLQALFYAASGTIVASALILFLMVPYFNLNPINYPIAKGGISIDGSEIIVRGLVLSLTAVFSGFLPAWLVTRQNTLDSILGR